MRLSCPLAGLLFLSSLRQHSFDSAPSDRAERARAQTRTTGTLEKSRSINQLLLFPRFVVSLKQ